MGSQNIRDWGIGMLRWQVNLKCPLVFQMAALERQSIHESGTEGREQVRDIKLAVTNM